MTTLRVSLGRTRSVFADLESGVRYTVPVGSDTLAAMIVADPPLPEELTNSIGIFLDHLEDVTREVPCAVFADSIEICGPGVQALIDTELGHAEQLPCNLRREAAEEVFRTLATEDAGDRAMNPGLPAPEVHHILGVCCAVVAILRGLRAPGLTVTGDTTDGEPTRDEPTGP